MEFLRSTGRVPNGMATGSFQVYENPHLTASSQGWPAFVFFFPYKKRYGLFSNFIWDSTIMFVILSGDLTKSRFQV
jgi:hypothetical protein